MTTGRGPWWKGTRGEGYLAGQLALMALVFLGPRAAPGWPAWPSVFAGPASIAGVLLMLMGGLLLFAGGARLGARLTPLPYPKDRSTLIVTGPYRWVRHPMYGGGILLAFGWAMAIHGSLTLGYAVALAVFLDVKSRREERWLSARYPEYAGYRTRVPKLIPFVY